MLYLTVQLIILISGWNFLKEKMGNLQKWNSGSQFGAPCAPRSSGL